MGTNYYWRLDDAGPRACPHCGQEMPNYQEWHIGKSSAGWAFLVRQHPDRDIISLDDWKKVWAKEKGSIFDEYGERISVEEMLLTITERIHPSGLLRHEFSEHGYTLGPRSGTYDYCVTEFS